MVYLIYVEFRLDLPFEKGNIIFKSVSKYVRTLASLVGSNKDETFNETPFAVARPKGDSGPGRWSNLLQNDFQNFKIAYLQNLS